VDAFGLGEQFRAVVFGQEQVIYHGCHPSLWCQSSDFKPRFRTNILNTEPLGKLLVLGRQFCNRVLLFDLGEKLSQPIWNVLVNVLE